MGRSVNLIQLRAYFPKIVKRERVLTREKYSGCELVWPHRMQVPLHTENDLKAAAVLDTVTARATLAAIVAFAFLSFYFAIMFIGSRPSDHYFRSVCLFVCLFVCAEFFSAVFDPLSIKLGHMLYVWV